jgi:hypothetical protein
MALFEIATATETIRFRRETETLTTANRLGSLAHQGAHKEARASLCFICAGCALYEREAEGYHSHRLAAVIT